MFRFRSCEACLLIKFRRWEKVAGCRMRKSVSNSHSASRQKEKATEPSKVPLTSHTYIVIRVLPTIQQNNMTIRKRTFITIQPRSSLFHPGGNSDTLPLSKRLGGGQGRSATKSIFAFCCGAVAIFFTLSFFQYLDKSVLVAFFAGASSGSGDLPARSQFEQQEKRHCYSHLGSHSS